MKQADLPRSANRAKINQLFNGDPPYTEQEATESNVQINVNFLEAAKIAHDARSAYENAFLKPGNYFSVTLDSKSVHKRREWGRTITKNINRCMKKSQAYMDAIRSTGASVILHGIGPVVWDDRMKWCPSPIGVEDVLIPSGTRVGLDNLPHFAVYREYTQARLFRMTHGDKVDPGWNMRVVNQQLKRMKDDDSTAHSPSYRELENPEKLVEMYKQNLGYYESDAAPTIDCWEFYFQADKGKGWERRIVLDYESKEGEKDFLYSSKRIYASNLSNIMHTQFADGANVAPFKYHSVRSLGYMLYAVCRINNRLRGRFLEAVFEAMKWYFRAASAEDRERLEKVDLFHQGIIPMGIEWVPANERFQVREQLVQSAFAQNRQSMSENSSSFTQDTNDGTQKEMTATESMARVNAAASLVSSMLNRAYNYQQFQYQEICRRFCIKDSNDPSVEKFQSECLKAGIPKEMLNVERWNIEPERVLGAGNKSLEIAQANQLMSARNLYDPEPQREILHIFTEAMTDDPQLADRLVPIEQKQVSDTVHDAELASSTLMMGLPMSVKTGHNHIEYIETLLRSISAVIARIEGTTKMATQQEIVGIQSVAAHIGEHVKILAQDKNEKQRVKQYGDALGKLMNFVKAYSQRLQEQQAEQQGGNGGLPPEAMAKIQSATILAQTNAKIKEAKAAQQMQHKDASFQAGEQRKDAQLQQDLQRQLQETQVDIAATDLTTQAEIIRQGRKPQKPSAS